MANTFLPAHLGEFLRAFMVQKKKSVSGSAVFGTVVIERIIDVFTMILLLAILMIVFPFPDWVQKSGYLSFIFILILFIMLVLLKKYRETSLRVLTKILFAFPQHVKDKVYGMVHTFLEGIVPLKSRWHYIMVAVLSIIIWICYAYVFQLVFYAFNFVDLYSLPWSTAFVLLVITTIAILVPSSPGYVGTYHWMCMIGLGLFNIPESEALSFAFVMHGLNFIPILIVGLVIISIEGISIKAAQKNAQMDIG
jgi:hypothetical protein